MICLGSGYTAVRDSIACPPLSPNLAVDAPHDRPDIILDPAGTGGHRT